MRPCFRLIQPNPPPSVRPPTPVVELMPSGVASAKACASLSKSASVHPGSTRAVRPTGSMRTERICDRSIKSPPSQTALPAMLWPPPRTATSSSFSRAKLTAPMASAAPAQRTITPGRRSIMAFQIDLAEVVAGVIRQVDGAAQAATQRLHVLGTNRCHPALERGKSYIRHARSSLAERPLATTSFGARGSSTAPRRTLTGNLPDGLICDCQRAPPRPSDQAGRVDPVAGGAGPLAQHVHACRAISLAPATRPSPSAMSTSPHLG